MCQGIVTVDVKLIQGRAIVSLTQPNADDDSSSLSRPDQTTFDLITKLPPRCRALSASAASAVISVFIPPPPTDSLRSFNDDCLEDKRKDYRYSGTALCIIIHAVQPANVS